MFKNESKNITIIGTGAYGTVLANVLTDNDHHVTMFGIEEEQVNDINNNHLNSRFFRDVKINSTIKATTSFSAAVENADYIILGIPVIAIKTIIAKINEVVKHPVVIINVAKGLDWDTHEVLSVEVNRTINPKIMRAYAGLYGPSIAQEVLERKPTCMMAVSDDLAVAKEVRDLFRNEYFIVFADNDVVGAEYGVALKNSVAIAAGMASGLYASDNAKASLITMGLNETKIFASQKKIKIETFINFAGLADLILTATSPKSRNFNLGWEIAQSDDAKTVLEAHSTTVEGVLTCKTVVHSARENNLYLPLFEALYAILFNNKKPSTVINSIFAQAII
ncbi:NAD(P)H-dependent glycerol-3-phosphate dehydrogenase [Spiroplasma syrphidicola EA-1]|uniref:Glycerol-3-phosphate dehydrogenase [NAD(P)+] n=1 Tax=Spiroplasma syrphidicola EA-1 TaxID=1276229 RepID=R4UIB7_9MOLU|nr:NAD(P)H-dependent glycerol-3-phosphate dehydrogenase [Spiroplasma syrphidicola]AGM25905.1 NAD(P)H-dependent glycerol-3-phosphate dehydrogenase [Spiroplasma syrphidicola EA-1]